MPQLNNLALTEEFITRVIKAYIQDNDIEFTVLEEGPDPQAPNKFIPEATLLGRKVYLHAGPLKITDNKGEAIFASTKQGALEHIAAF
jgi:hypothetical protein